MKKMSDGHCRGLNIFNMVDSAHPTSALLTVLRQVFIRCGIFQKWSLLVFGIKVFLNSNNS
jgi:hypothetical protein